jgi:16S rRNA (cytosine1402-N4)-methyltransferase
MESALEHQPVLLNEVVAALRPRSGGRYFDGTCGGGSHSAAILEASGPDGWLYACDRDEEALAAAALRLAPFAGRFALTQGNFSEVRDWIPGGSCHGALMDLGVNSYQLTSEQRGFSFQFGTARLDMRMDRRRGPTAADILNRWEAGALERLLWDNDESHARRIVRGVVEARSVRPFETVGQLVEVVGRAVPGRPGRTHPATKVFQALRMVVNEELESLRRGLEASMDILAPGGVLAVISFHSGEDRLVKEFLRQEARDYDVPPGEPDLPHLRRTRDPRGRLVYRKGIEPSAAEVAGNPRARSARLRVLEKL